ncbi:MAG: sulfatase [Bacteroidales bacterium]|nr:sulfatase [Bacteroidales bacterium]
MKNLFFLLLAIAGLSSCVGSNDKKDSSRVEKKPNVLFIVVDDLTTTLGCYGHPIVKTPNIDKLAAMGVQFDHAYCNYSVCNPSRSSFLTGMKPETTTILDNRKTLQSVIGDWVSLPALFRQNGYYTMNLGKIYHTIKEEDNDYKGWDEIYDFKATELGEKGERRNMTEDVLKWCWWMAAEGEDEDQGDGQIAKKAVEFIKSDHEKPFFLAVGLHKPHDPFIAPKKYFEMYPLEDCTPPELPEGWEPVYKHSLPGETTIFNKFTDRERREFLRSYYACSSFMDAQVGKVMNALEESGQLENTLIFFFGDHGYHLGEHNWWNKVTIYQNGTKAPFIVAGPNVAEGVRSQSMFEFIDIYPTLAEASGLDSLPEYLEGKSFAEVLQYPSLDFRSEVRAVVRRGDMLGRTVKNKKWRYIEWDEGKKGRELYDEENDPVEYFNLAESPEYQEVVAEMKGLLYQDY